MLPLLVAILLRRVVGNNELNGLGGAPVTSMDLLDVGVDDNTALPFEEVDGEG